MVRSRAKRSAAALGGPGGEHGQRDAHAGPEGEPDRAVAKCGSDGRPDGGADGGPGAGTSCSDEDHGLLLRVIGATRYGYKVPVLITGCTSLSAHSTVMRLLTMAALRSSSSATTFLAERSFNAISTIDTAPMTIFCRAAMIASACCLRSITCAIS